MSPSSPVVCSGQLHGNLHFKETLDWIFRMPFLLFNLFALCSLIPHHEWTKWRAIKYLLRSALGLSYPCGPLSTSQRAIKKKKKKEMTKLSKAPVNCLSWLETLHWVYGSLLIYANIYIFPTYFLKIDLSLPLECLLEPHYKHKTLA